MTGTATFTAAAARATLTRGDLVYATGTGTPHSGGGYRLTLHADRLLLHGTYVLTLTVGRGTHQRALRQTLRL